MKDTLTNIREWFEAAVPNPTPKNQAVQIGCHFEEVVEMTDALNTSYNVKLASMSFKDSDDVFHDENGDPVNLLDNWKTELLDSLCDQIVTAIGVAYMFGMDIEGALAEVNASNYSKFEDGKPVFNKQGKITKGKDYFRPELEKFL